MAWDRLDRSESKVTHELLATMLGARRAGVSQAAATLQAAGCMTYRCGVIEFLDHDALDPPSVRALWRRTQSNSISFQRDQEARS